MAPATMKRVPAMKNGGRDSITMRMARYVEPQMMYRAANAATTLVCWFMADHHVGKKVGSRVVGDLVVSCCFLLLKVVLGSAGV